uniref:Uncharacterized protein n=1 Tax=Pseudo-nitzschia australis TaxID=44445 RepID=A0A7S4AXG9_9STRA
MNATTKRRFATAAITTTEAITTATTKRKNHNATTRQLQFQFELAARKQNHRRFIGNRNRNRNLFYAATDYSITARSSSFFNCHGKMKQCPVDAANARSIAGRQIRLFTTNSTTNNTTTATNSRIRKQKRKKKKLASSTTTRITTKDRLRLSARPSATNPKSGTNDSSFIDDIDINRMMVKSPEEFFERLNSGLDIARTAAQETYASLRNPAIAATSRQPIQISGGASVAGAGNSSAGRNVDRKGIIMDANWWSWNLLFASSPAILIGLYCEFVVKPRMKKLYDEKEKEATGAAREGGETVDGGNKQDGKKSPVKMSAMRQRQEERKCELLEEPQETDTATTNNVLSSMWLGISDFIINSDSDTNGSYFGKMSTLSLESLVSWMLTKLGISEFTINNDSDSDTNNSHFGETLQKLESWVLMQLGSSDFSYFDDMLKLCVQSLVSWLPKPRPLQTATPLPEQDHDRDPGNNHHVEESQTDNDNDKKRSDASAPLPHAKNENALVDHRQQQSEQILQQLEKQQQELNELQSRMQVLKNQIDQQQHEATKDENSSNDDGNASGVAVSRDATSSSIPKETSSATQGNRIEDTEPESLLSFLERTTKAAAMVGTNAGRDSWGVLRSLWQRRDQIHPPLPPNSDNDSDTDIEDDGIPGRVESDTNEAETTRTTTPTVVPTTPSE